MHRCDDTNVKKPAHTSEFSTSKVVQDITLVHFSMYPAQRALCMNNAYAEILH